MSDEAKNCPEMGNALKQYFEQTDTPSEGSSVGRLMVKILEPQSWLVIRGCHGRGAQMLQKAVGDWRYVLPRY